MVQKVSVIKLLKNLPTNLILYYTWWVYVTEKDDFSLNLFAIDVIIFGSRFRSRCIMFYRYLHRPCTDCTVCDAFGVIIIIFYCHEIITTIIIINSARAQCVHAEIVYRHLILYSLYIYCSMAIHSEPLSHILHTRTHI